MLYLSNLSPTPFPKAFAIVIWFEWDLLLLLPNPFRYQPNIDIIPANLGNHYLITIIKNFGGFPVQTFYPELSCIFEICLYPSSYFHPQIIIFLTMVRYEWELSWCYFQVIWLPIKHWCSICNSLTYVKDKKNVNKNAKILRKSLRIYKIKNVYKLIYY